MRKASGRRAQYLSYQNKLAEAELEETTVKLDRQFVSKRSAYELERRQLAQELRDLSRGKRCIGPRSSSTPPTDTSGNRAIRKISTPSRLLSGTREPEFARSDSSDGETFFRRPRAKSRSLVDLPGELRNLEGTHNHELSMSYERLPFKKQESSSLNMGTSCKKSPASIFYHKSISTTNSLPPLSTSDGLNYFQGSSTLSDRQKDKQPIVGPDIFRVPRTFKHGTVTTQRPQLRPLKLLGQPSNHSEELAQLIYASNNAPFPEQRVTEASSDYQPRFVSEPCAKRVFRGSQSDNIPGLHPTPGESRVNQESEAAGQSSPRGQRATMNVEMEITKDEAPEDEDMQLEPSFLSPSIPDGKIETNKTVKSESGQVQAPKGDKPPTETKPTLHSSDFQINHYGQLSSDTCTNEMPVTSLPQSSQTSASQRKTSTGSQQGNNLLGPAPSQEALQRAVRKVSVEGSPPLVNISAALHGTLRRPGTGLAASMSSAFLDQAEGGGIALDSDLVAISNFNLGRRPSQGVPTNAAERSRERGSMALRGNRARQEDPSTAEVIRYYQDVPEAAALAGISVEPLDLTELESCRYLRKYVPKSMRDGDHTDADA